MSIASDKPLKQKESSKDHRRVSPEIPNVPIEEALRRIARVAA
jgi:hypothetical protein